MNFCIEKKKLMRDHEKMTHKEIMRKVQQNNNVRNIFKIGIKENTIYNLLTN